jgi:hypothetical protein
LKITIESLTGGEGRVLTVYGHCNKCGFVLLAPFTARRLNQAKKYIASRHKEKGCKGRLEFSKNSFN